MRFWSNLRAKNEPRKENLTIRPGGVAGSGYPRLWSNAVRNPATWDDQMKKAAKKSPKIGNLPIFGKIAEMKNLIFRSKIKSPKRELFCPHRAKRGPKPPYKKVRYLGDYRAFGAVLAKTEGFGQNLQSKL